MEILYSSNKHDIDIWPRFFGKYKMTLVEYSFFLRAYLWVVEIRQTKFYTLGLKKIRI